MRSTTSLASLSAPFAFFSSAGKAAFQAVEIGQHQFGLDRLDIGDRRDLAVDMGDVVVDEAAHDMGDRVAFADRGEELVAESFALGSPAHEAGDIDEGEAGRNDLLRAGDRGERLQPRVGYGDIADVRLDRAEGIIGRLRRRGLRQGIEEGRFADVRQTDDAAFETHGTISVGGARAPEHFPDKVIVFI